MTAITNSLVDYLGQPGKENSKYQDHSNKRRGEQFNYKEPHMVGWQAFLCQPLHRNHSRHIVCTVLSLEQYNSAVSRHRMLKMSTVCRPTHNQEPHVQSRIVLRSNWKRMHTYSSHVCQLQSITLCNLKDMPSMRVSCHPRTLLERRVKVTGTRKAMRAGRDQRKGKDSM